MGGRGRVPFRCRGSLPPSHGSGGKCLVWPRSVTAPSLFSRPEPRGFGRDPDRLVAPEWSHPGGGGCLGRTRRHPVGLDLCGVCGRVTPYSVGVGADLQSPGRRRPVRRQCVRVAGGVPRRSPVSYEPLVSSRASPNVGLLRRTRYGTSLLLGESLPSPRVF